MDEKIIKKMNEELIKKTAVKVNVLGGTELDEVIKFLDEANKNGKNIYVVFNDKNLYSMLDDKDSCYKKVTGYTKGEYDAIHQKVDALKERSKNLVFFEKSADWFVYIINSVEDPFKKGKDAELAISVMEFLDAGDSARAHQIMAQADREYAFALTAILQFAKDGPEFYKEEIAGLGLELEEEARELIKSIEAQNNQYKNNGEAKD